MYVDLFDVNLFWKKKTKFSIFSQFTLRVFHFSDAWISGERKESTN